MKKTYVYRMYPTAEQDRYLRETMETCRRLYNWALEQRKTAWESEKRRINFFAQSAMLPKMKKDNVYLAAAPAKCLIAVLKRLDQSYQNFFRRVKAGERPGYPRFKSRQRYSSINFTQWDVDCKFRENGRLWLGKVGDVRVRGGRAVEGQPKNCTVILKADGWHARIVCEVDQPEPLPKTGESIGIDVGLTKFATLSNGEVFENPRHWKRAERKLRRAHRRLSRRVKGSNRRAKARQLLAKAYLKVQRQRQDFHHKVTHDLVTRFDSIAVEDLNIQGMVKNHPLAKHISDAGWYQFRQFLSYKAEWAGREVIAVNARGTSQNCSNCGQVVPKKLSDRWHSCPYCGHEADRDHNAAVNIASRGAALVAA